MAGRLTWIVATAFILATVKIPLLSAHADDVAEGQTYFLRYCASCHGLTADGHGPVAKILSPPPSDLRRLGERYGTPLPAEQIARFIDGRVAVPAHGEREMPVWGERFHEIDAEGSAREAAIQSHVAKIVAYLNTIQLAPERVEPSEANLESTHPLDSLDPGTHGKEE